EPGELLFCNTGGGEKARISILSGVPPFTVTHTFNAAGNLRREATGAIRDTITCSRNSIIYIVQVPSPSSFAPHSVVIKDSEGRSVSVWVQINVEDGPDVCGNGVIDPGEQCDTSDLNGESCTTLGFTGGVLTCNSSCAFDTSECAACGNGTVEPGEEC